MASALGWPALEGIEASLAHEVRVRRGVWGKVHAARTDFRWIARSDGFGDGVAHLEELFSAGPEEQPARACFWRAAHDREFARRWLAIAAYPSRAVDKAGRRGFCERQVLEWVPARELPATAAALLLLPRAEALDDALWWDRAPLLAGAPELVLPISDQQAPRFEATTQALTDAVSRGLRELAAATDVDFAPHLAALYTAILAEREPAVLEGLRRPLSGAALAALLLPLPRPLADRLSLAGWLFSAVGEPARLARNWQVVILPPETSGWSSILRCSPNVEGSRLAEALLAGEPPARPALRPEPASADRPPRQPDRQQRDLPRQLARPGTVLTLAEPGPGAPAVLREVFDFARALDRRWLAPQALERIYLESPHAGSVEPAHCERLFVWIEQVSAHRPEHAHEEQWAVKLDLLRALALALMPSPETVRRVGTFESGRVPPLLYAPVFVAGLAMLRDRLGDDAFRWCAEEGRRCRSRRWVGWVEEEWRARRRRSLLR